MICIVDVNVVFEINVLVEEFQGVGFNFLGVGYVVLVWILDSQVFICMSCDFRFIFIKRRYYCRGCGKVRDFLFGKIGNNECCKLSVIGM